MDEGKAKKDGVRWLFSQTAVTAAFLKILTYTMLIHFKETPKRFLFLAVKNMKNQQWNT